MKQARLSVLINKKSKRLRKIPKRVEKLLKECDTLTAELTRLEKIVTERLTRARNA